MYSDLHNFFEGLSDESRIAGLDLGTKKIGIAISDRSKTIALSRATLKSLGTISKDIDSIINFLKPDVVEAMVIGLPLSLDGQETKMSNYVRQFAHTIKSKSKIRIYLHNEALTSHDAMNFLTRTKGFSIKKALYKIDETAAAIILQEILDRHSKSINAN